MTDQTSATPDTRADTDGADKSFDIGARLLSMRKAAGLSQRQLAVRAGVPHAQISIPGRAQTGLQAFF